jgi:hypothetical protein
MHLDREREHDAFHPQKTHVIDTRSIHVAIISSDTCSTCTYMYTLNSQGLE